MKRSTRIKTSIAAILFICTIASLRSGVPGTIILFGIPFSLLAVSVFFDFHNSKKE
jgi:hypothetical protein